MYSFEVNAFIYGCPDTREALLVDVGEFDPRADPLILDNLNGSIQPASRRTDLVPVFSFNDDDLRFPGNAMVVQMNSSSVRLWQILTEKLVREMAY